MPLGTRQDRRFTTALVHYTRLFSAVSKELSISRVLRTSPEVLIATVNNLHQAAVSLHESQPPEYRLDMKWDPASRVGGLSYLPLQFNFWGLLCHIHSIFLYPWANDLIERTYAGHIKTSDANTAGTHQQQAWQTKLREQMKVSSEILAAASRKIILTTRAIPVMAGSPKTYADLNSAPYQSCLWR